MKGAPWGGVLCLLAARQSMGAMPRDKRKDASPPELCVKFYKTVLQFQNPTSSFDYARLGARNVRNVIRCFMHCAIHLGYLPKCETPSREPQGWRHKKRPPRPGSRDKGLKKTWSQLTPAATAAQTTTRSDQRQAGARHGKLAGLPGPGRAAGAARGATSRRGVGSGVGSGHRAVRKLE